MKTLFRKSFLRDLKKIKDRDILDRVQKAIEEVEAASDITVLGQLKKMTGTTSYFRIRIGDYRIGIAVDEDTVEFVRCLSRKDLYRYFP